MVFCKHEKSHILEKSEKSFVELKANKKVTGIKKGYFVAFEEEGSFLLLFEKGYKEHEWLFRPDEEWDNDRMRNDQDKKNSYLWELEE